MPASSAPLADSAGFSPASLPRPTWSERRCFGHSEIPETAALAIDRVLTFYGLDPMTVRREYIDTCRRRPVCRLSWVARRSEYEAAQTFRHARVRFAFDDIIIRSGKTLVIESPFGDPVDLITYRLAIEPGGVLRIEAPLTLTIGQLLGLPKARSAYADAAAAGQILFSAPDGLAGLAGAPGADGAAGDDANPHGVEGSAGLIGGAGQPGRDLPDQTVFIHHLGGHLTLAAQAGKGGAGGHGGPGGQGGRGHAIAFFDMGRGGRGGGGGDGGDGGRGGGGGRFEIGIRARAEGACLTLTMPPAPGGACGAPGMPGSGGLGAPDGLPGPAGSQGRHGPDGIPISLVWTEGKDPPDA